MWEKHISLLFIERPKAHIQKVYLVQQGPDKRLLNEMHYFALHNAFCYGKPSVMLCILFDKVNPEVELQEGSGIARGSACKGTDSVPVVSSGLDWETNV